MQEQLLRLIKAKMTEKAEFNRVKTPHVLCFALSGQLKLSKFFPEEFMSILSTFLTLKRQV